MTSEELARAKEAHSLMAPAQRDAHNRAWGRCQQFVIELMEQHHTPNPKVYEVNHAIAHARRTYLTGLLAGHPADMCERQTLALYPGYGYAPDGTVRKAA